MPKAITLLAIMLSAVTMHAQQVSRPCELISWKSVQEKLRDSSLNSAYYFTVGNEGLSRIAQGLMSSTVALDVETEANVRQICNTLELQQAELDEMRAEVTTLRKQVAQMNRTVARKPTAK